MFNLRTVAVAAIMTLIGAGEAFAGEAHCWCKVSNINSTGASGISGAALVKDWGAVGGAYLGLNPQKDSNQVDCQARCTNHSSARNGDVQAAACANGTPNGARVTAFAAVGTRVYASAHYHGTLQKANAVYSCPQGGSISGTNCVFPALPVTKTCPAGWYANETNTSGGVTASGMCKAGVAGCALPAPLPANGTQIGSAPSYGFTWGNGVYVWGNAGNGGAPLISCPKGYTVSGNNCIKASYAATLVTPAICKF